MRGLPLSVCVWVFEKDVRQSVRASDKDRDGCVWSNACAAKDFFERGDVGRVVYAKRCNGLILIHVGTNAPRSENSRTPKTNG